MNGTNIAAIMYKMGDLRLEECSVPEPGPGQVLLRMQHVGICGTDVHFLQNGVIGDFQVKAPMILGHEAAGIVSKLGQGVATLKIGDRVAIEPAVPCKLCETCKKGRYNLCPMITCCATPPTHGNLARFYVHDANFCFKLPDHVSTEEGALLEPLSVSVHACTRAGVTQGTTVLICGAGPIGLLVLLTAKAQGASRVCITDINQSRLDIARKLGADLTVSVTSEEDPKKAAAKIEKAFGEMPDISIECSGAPSALQTAIYATKAGGCVMVVGIGPSEVPVPIVSAACREVDIKATFRYLNCYPIALEMVASGKVDVKPLITHRFTLEESLKAFETTHKGEGIKVMIRCGKD